VKALLISFGFLFASGALRAQTQMPLWPGTPPGPRRVRGAEATGTVTKSLIAGRPWTYVANVSRPTLTIYPPKGKNSGAAVVVFPGGGYLVLAVDLEGTEACDWLTSKGMTCVLLQYRVPNRDPQWDQECGCDRDTHSSMALQDAQRTISLVRSHAKEWHIDSHKIGVLGFSAGGHLVAAVSTRYQRRVYSPIDAADRESCRPDFAMALYPGHLWISGRLNSDIHVTRDTPPTFLLQAEDDPVDSVNNSLVYYRALKSAGVPAELHLYPQGGHAFGLRRTNSPITAWPTLAETWLKAIEMIGN
jgi:acetyl esterase/lipase